MAQYNIAVTGLNAADAPCSGISVIRCLRQGFRQAKASTAGRRAGVKIIGLAYELLCSTSYASDIIDEVYCVPFPAENEDSYLSRMSQITRKTKIDLLIPNLDFEIAVISKLESELRDLGIRLLLPSQEAVMLSKKENLPKLSQSTGLACPFTVVFSDRRKITEAAANFVYPLIVKASNGEACTAYSLEESIVFSMRLLALWGPPLMMQQFIKGDEYCVASLADRRHKVLGSVCMKKILKSRNGTAWMGVTAKDDELMSLSKKIIERLDWAGPIEIEFIKEQVSQKYFLIEINPRFPSWIELAAQAGCNLPAMAAKIALRQKVECSGNYTSGILFARSAVDISCDISRLGRLATLKDLFHYDKDKK